MKNTILFISTIITSFGIGFYLSSTNAQPADSTVRHPETTINKEENMKLGAFSVSLSVKDIKASQDFYEKLGFTVFAGDINNNYLIMKNGNCLIGLFYGMFEGNMLTFNPGWDENANFLEDFNDVREIQRQLKNHGIAINPEADENTTGPASFMVKDPDGNVLLFDQHR